MDKEELKGIISKYTKPDMLQWSHQIDKTKPVATCFYSTEDYENCIEEILDLAKIKDDVVIAEGRVKYDDVNMEYLIGGESFGSMRNFLNKKIRLKLEVLE